MRISLYPSHTGSLSPNAYPLGKGSGIHPGGFIKSIFSAAKGYRAACWVPAQESETLRFPWQLFQERNLGFHCWHPEKKEGEGGGG